MDQSRENIIEDSQDEIDIGELLRYLKTKWIVIVAVFLIGVTWYNLIIGLYRAFEDQTDLQRDHQ